MNSCPSGKKGKCATVTPTASGERAPTHGTHGDSNNHGKIFFFSRSNQPPKDVANFS
jgi:hypothetical protein